MKRFWSSGLLSLLVSCCLVMCLWPSAASANNGLWNFYDYPFFDGGFPEGAADVQGIQVAPIYNVGKSLSGPDRSKVPGINETDALVMLFQWVYFYPEAVQPWSWLLPSDNKHFTLSSDMFFSYATVHADTSGTSGAPLGVGVGGGGVGDLDWTPLGIGIAYQHWQYEDWVKPTGYISPLISFPLGDYQSNAAFNLGSNAWTILPAFIGWTYLGKNFGPLEGSEWQTDLIYFHTFVSNDQVPTGTPGKFTTFTPGDDLVWNNAFLVPVLKSLKAGVGITWTQTLGAAELGGQRVPHSEVQELGIGPAFSSHVGPVNLWVSMASDILTRNAYRQLGFYVTADYAFPTSALYKDQVLDWMKR